MSDQLFRLFQLVSPSLPVGAYAYSGGLESAAEAKLVTDQETAAGWISDLLVLGLARLEVPVFFHLYEAWRVQDHPAVVKWNQKLQANRETKELLAEDRQQGLALRVLLEKLGIEDTVSVSEPSFLTMYALASQFWGVEPESAIKGFCWAWAENQVMAAIKLVPLGQTQGQSLLLALSDTLEEAVQTGAAMEDDEIGQSLPGLAILSATHENQYSRLFRS